MCMCVHVHACTCTLMVTLYSFYMNVCLMHGISYIFVQMMDATDEADLQSCLSGDDYSFIFDCGCTSIITMENRVEVLETVWQHHTHFAIHAELSQLREGLRDTLNFGTLIDLHPAGVLKLLSTSERVPLTMDQMLEPLHSQVL